MTSKVSTSARGFGRLVHNTADAARQVKSATRTESQRHRSERWAFLPVNCTRPAGAAPSQSVHSIGSNTRPAQGSHSQAVALGAVTRQPRSEKEKKAVRERSLSFLHVVTVVLQHTSIQTWGHRGMGSRTCWLFARACTIAPSTCPFEDSPSSLAIAYTSSTRGNTSICTRGESETD